MKVHQSLINHKTCLNKCKKIWLFYRKIWFLPFICAFTWYLGWILRDIAVWHKPLNQMNPTNYAGTIISIALILSATHIGRGIRSAIVRTHFGSHIRSAIAFVGNQSGRNFVRIHITEGVQIAPISIGTQTNDIIQMEKPKQQIQRVSIRIEKPKQPIGHSQQSFSSVSVCPYNLDYFSLRPRPKQVPAECIACGNLIQCVCLTNI